MKHTFTATLLAACALAMPAIAQQTPAPEGATVYFISPSDGATVSNPVTIQFGLSGMGVAPAGYDVDNTGHHHLLINIDPSDVDMTTSLPASDQVVHFGGGQTEVTKDLPAGTHTLRLLLGDYSHVPHDPPVMSEEITITVE
ncbi:DUF4399 domain-containing protein [Meridianimarinicoccus aquatilis]|uniref:DUF4399 domain-containing protein n=1 Tax=Meridianimarinicoccus aquatilis TaxID=2552766 RepID=A0A4R6AZI7_9RHOB|nr:DUF4399 domain-containing protein [Fluviibacterium aquatile]TDL87856.1 DUF4399 domain-containing protein [Fluviibacterium aquatile]